MDGSTLSKAMGGTLPVARYTALAPAFTKALSQAGCTTVNRAAMFCAQLAHESAGLKWMEELASGSAYEGRDDLGNTHKGDGVRFKGRGPIQVTGRHNYTACSTWAYRRGYVPTATYFVDNPSKLSSDQYGFLGAVWYWTVARNMNAFADKKDIRGATLAVNGGTRGLAERTAAWKRCLAIGTKLLAGAPKPPKSTTKTTPLIPTANAIHTPYGATGSMWKTGKHQGDDWHRGAGAAEIGDPIYAIADGRVIHQGEARSDSPGWGPAFGNHVLITWANLLDQDKGRRRTMIDAHMSKVAVKYDQQVKAGDVIGYKGMTGNVDGPHDHHEQHLGQGYGDTVVKPVYPGKTVTTTTKDAEMPAPKKWHRTKDRVLKKSKSYQSVPLDNASKVFSMAGGPGTIRATVNITTNKDCWARFITFNKNGTKGKISTPYPRVKVKAGGDQLELWDTIGGPAKGYKDKLVRLQVLAYSYDVTVQDLMVRASKEA